MNRSGDIEAYLPFASSDDLVTLKQNIEARVRAPQSFVRPGNPLQANLKRYFNDIDIDAIAQRKSMSQNNDFKIIVNRTWPGGGVLPPAGAVTERPAGAARVLRLAGGGAWRPTHL